jgi:hypothetical protein
MLITDRAMHAVSIGGFRRNLQSPSPLQIMFDTKIQFVSDRQDWNANDMVAGGFDTSSDQTKYILKLKEWNTTHFDNLSSMSLEVEGEPVTEPVIEESNNGNSLYYIIAGVVGGALVIVLSLAVIYYRNQNKRTQRGDPPFNVVVVEVDKDEGEEIPFDNNTFPDTLNHQSYFGTIQQTISVRWGIHTWARWSIQQ